MLSNYLRFIKSSLLFVRKEIIKISERMDRAKVVGRAFYGDESILIDRIADEAIALKIKEVFKDFTYISEESGIMKRGKGVPYILADPLDGSTNAKRGISNYCTAIAVSEGETFEDIVAAGVIEHQSGEMIWGFKGSVFEGWKRAKLSSREDLENSLIIFDPKIRSNPENLQNIIELMKSTKYPRMIGAAAWEVASLASGRVEAVIAYPGFLRTFDCLPSLFLLKQVGGKAVYIGKKPSDLTSKEGIRFVAACNNVVLNKVISILKVEGSTLF